MDCYAVSSAALVFCAPAMKKAGAEPLSCEPLADFLHSRSLRSREEASQPLFAGRPPPCVRVCPPRRANVESFRLGDPARPATATIQSIFSGVEPLLCNSLTGEVFRSVGMMIPRLLELRQRNEKKLAEGSVKMQDLVKTATSRLMI